MILKNFLIKIILIPYTLINKITAIYSAVLNFLKPGLGNIGEEKVSKARQDKTQIVTHTTLTSDKFTAKILIPNELCRFRAETFSTKEPETLAWIDQYGGDGPLFDIGANIGLYSIYYAATKNARVYSFEPSFLNLSLLAKNIYINKLSDLISIVPNPLSEINNFADFILSTTEEGGALSAFGVTFGFDGRPIDRKLTYQTLGLQLDFLFETNILKEIPKLIKIDVDGIEHIILAGSKNVLKHPDCKSVLIEVTDTFKEQSIGVKSILEEAGFVLVKKLHSEMFSSGDFSSGYNQIWIKM